MAEEARLESVYTPKAYPEFESRSLRPVITSEKGCRPTTSLFLMLLYAMGMIEFGPHEEIKKLYNTPVNRRLKYCALGAISVSIALMIIMIIWMDEISAKMKLFMRGCAGLCAIVFVILCGCLVYRVCSAWFRQK